MDNTHEIIIPESRTIAKVANGGFLDNPAPAPQSREVAHATAREEGDTKSQLWLAQNKPRAEATCYAKMITAMGRATMAERATYSFKRGKGNVSGPSVTLARELARIWGNVRYGFRIVEASPDYTHIRAYAHDLESNAFIEAEDRFERLIQRKDYQTGKTHWVEPDERDARELLNRRASLLIRNCILQVLPGDLVDECVNEAARTMKKAAAGELSQNRDDAVRRLVATFHKLGVTQEQIERRIERPAAQVSEEQLVDLRSVLGGIREGLTTVDKEFPPVPTAAQELAAKIKGEK